VSKVKIEKEVLLAARIRLVENKLIELYPTDVIQSPLHLSIGQESVAVGVCRDLSYSDLLFSTYRSHAFYLAKDGNLDEFFAELFGKKTGCCGGKGGSMHLAYVGAALANKILGKSENIVVCVFGDGAVDSGVYHECLNFASLHSLKLVFVLEDNGLAVHSRTQERQVFDHLAHARTYGIECTEIVDSSNPKVVADQMCEIYNLVRSSQGPHLVKIKTFRYMEHVGVNQDFDQGYRSESELLEWKRKDPVEAIIQLTDEDSIKSINMEISKSVKFAENSAYPEIEDLYREVF
jgi:TPP-dependent pyruvate/acetoin dehydrogenase alpha subunit